jgi:hypothetical protein
MSPSFSIICNVHSMDGGQLCTLFFWQLLGMLQQIRKSMHSKSMTFNCLENHTIYKEKMHWPENMCFIVVHKSVR